MGVKLVIRGIVTWTIEAVALIVLVGVVPGVHLAGLPAGVLAVMIIGALNALVRPIVLLFAEHLGLVFLTAVALVLNAASVLLATRVVPGFTVDSLWNALVLAFGLAILNTLLSGLLGINDDDSFYRNVIRWLERRRAPQADLDELGTIFIQIDGLAEPLLQRAIEAGDLPTLGRWISSGSHRLTRWECDIPSMTSSAQSGILYGNNANIPAFRWYEKSAHRLLVSNHPRDARIIDERQATSDGLLVNHGSSVGNIFAGGAEHCVITMSRLTTESGQLNTRARDLYDYFLNPYNLYRAIGAMVWEMAVEVWEGWRQRLRNEQPRMSRGGVYPLVRAITTILLRDITTWMLVADMFGGRRVAYADYLGYDEVAHHSGPATSDARRVLRKMEGQFRQLENAARRAPRRYQLVVLSDHGQSTGATFRQRYGLTLAELVGDLVRRDSSVDLAGGQGEGSEQVNALAAEAAQLGGLFARGARLMRSVVKPKLATPGDVSADVVVCASGNLALVYFTETAGRLSLEEINQLHPRLIEGLVQHSGIGFVLVHSDAAGGPLVLSRQGRRSLNAGAKDEQEDDPLVGLSPHTADYLRRLSTYNDVGDIVVNSLWEGDTQQVAAFEELIGCHGGAGGLQTSPFLLYPSAWGDPAESICGAEDVHTFLRQHVGPAQPKSESTCQASPRG